MVGEQLQDRGISDARVLDAMRRVPRQEFVPAHLREMAYQDCALPLDHGQTISQPFIVGFMTEALETTSDQRVLEVGSGCGYQAAVLSLLVKEVFSIEIVEALAIGAAERLRRLGYDNVQVRHGDGHLGWPERAPFDAIIATCAPKEIPEALVEQLREGGHMAIPVGHRGVQDLIVLTKEEGSLRQNKVMQVRFVPMTGQE
jgi:protein-L-isoaspartate(D-aspartate) O-methyltransferase